MFADLEQWVSGDRIKQDNRIYHQKHQTHLTHWGRVTHICVSKLTIIGSDNSLSPEWRQAIIWTNAGILLIGALVTNFSENLIEILTFSFNKMHLKMSSAKWRLFRLGLNVLMVLEYCFYSCLWLWYDICPCIWFEQRNANVTLLHSFIEFTMVGIQKLKHTKGIFVK